LDQRHQRGGPQRPISAQARVSLGIALAALLLSGKAALAAFSLTAPGQGFSTDGSLTVTTNALPKGWFQGSGGFDRAKSEVRVDIEIDDSACSAASTVTANSKTDGTFTPVYNPGGQINGYIWSVTLDLSSYRDHWHNQVHCDGSTSVEGCPDPRLVSVTAAVFNQDGTCKVDAGQCISVSKTGSLTSVQDPDAYDICAQCDIGSCTSQCEQDCNGDFSTCTSSCSANAEAAKSQCDPGPDGKDCRAAARENEQACDNLCNATHQACSACCECDCKSRTPGCTPQDECYRETGHPQCLF
jgi:hypothetical protein